MRKNYNTKRHLLQGSVCILLILSIAIISVSPEVAAETDASDCTNRQTCMAVVKRVIDGDTVELASGERVRYIGIDAPETGKSRQNAECFHKEATEKNKELVAGRQVRLEKDVSDKDSFGRLLRYVYVEEAFVNDHLVRNGYANAAAYPPDVRFQDQFRKAEQEARDNQRGLWAEGACDNTSGNAEYEEPVDELENMFMALLDRLEKAEGGSTTGMVIAIIFFILSAAGLYKRYRRR